MASQLLLQTFNVLGTPSIKSGEEINKELSRWMIYPSLTIHMPSVNGLRSVILNAPLGADLNAYLNVQQDHMAAAFRFWGKQGYGDGISGHITVRDPVLEGHYW